MGYNIQVIIRSRPGNMINKDIYNAISEVAERATGLKSQVMVRNKSNEMRKQNERIGGQKNKQLR